MDKIYVIGSNDKLNAKDFTEMWDGSVLLSGEEVVVFWKVINHSEKLWQKGDYSYLIRCNEDIMNQNLMMKRIAGEETHVSEPLPLDVIEIIEDCINNVRVEREKHTLSTKTIDLHISRLREELENSRDSYLGKNIRAGGRESFKYSAVLAKVISDEINEIRDNSTRESFIDSVIKSAKAIFEEKKWI